ncbi:MAG TPA: glycosyltransferase family 2 protein [Methylovirgula sp.]|nr:glycosyltransferase family 2 protein [Methylovirgula sp.]
MELISCAWAVVVAVLILRAFGQRNLLKSVDPRPLPADVSAPNVALIVPARDEEANVARCLSSLVRQAYPAERLKIILVDDHSADATRKIAEKIAQSDPRLAILCAPPLPAGWTGKSHACAFGAAATQADYLCFLDADMRAEPLLLASTVATALAEDLDLLSLAPRQELKSFAERLVIPCGLFFMSFCQNLAKLQAADCDDCTVTGQFMLVRRSVYDRVGGHAAVRSAICEDRALGRQIKRAGGRVILHDGRKLLSTRMYTGWTTLWPGLAKNLVDMLGGPASTIGAAAIGFLLAWTAWLVPLAAGLGCAHQDTSACVALLPALLGSGAALGLHVAGAAYFRIPFWYGFLFPLGYTAGAAMAIDSVRRHLTGAVTWKGRTYP